MARLNGTSALFALAVGMLLCVAFAPISNWSFKNDVNTVFEGGKLNELFVRAPQKRPFPWFEGGPPALLDAKQIPMNSKESRLARALGLAEWDQANPTGNWDNGVREGLRELDAYCKDYPKDIAAQAHFLRLLSQSLGNVVPNAQVRASKQYQNQSMRMRPVYLQMLSISKKGASLDSENAYWPLMSAVVLCKLELTAEAKQAFLDASRGKTFEDYASEDPKIGLQEFQNRWRYRGEATRLFIPASVLFPHYASFKAVFRLFCISERTTEALKTRWAGIRLSNMLLRDGSSAICMFVGRACLAIAVVGNEKMPDEVKSTHGEQHVQAVLDWEQELANALDVELAKLGIILGAESPSAIYSNARKMMDAARAVIEDPFTTRVTEHPFVGSAASALGFTAIVFFVPITGLVALWCHRWPESYDRSRLFFVSAIFCVGLLLIRMDAQGSEYPPRLDADIFAGAMLLLYAAAFVFASVGKSRKALAVTCLIAAAPPFIIAFMGPIPPAGVVIGLVNALCLLIVYKWPTHLGTTLFAMVIVVLMGFAVVRFDNIVSTDQIRELFMAILLLVLAAPSRWFRNWAAASALAISLCYLVATAYSLKINADLKTIQWDWMHEADTIRARAGLTHVPD